MVRFDVFFQSKKSSASDYLVVWVGGLDSWDPFMKGIVT